MNHASLLSVLLDLTTLLALANGTLARVMQVKDW